jgi:carbonic anhydrase/acetyltransferase-like protein (isoleucine patch superfamily)
MNKYAVINQNSVMNVIVCENAEIAKKATGHTCVLIPEGSLVGIGSLYDGTNFVIPEPNLITVDSTVIEQAAIEESVTE